ncbi:MAG: hypothetical protein AAGI66_05800 [Cyanobacteria bacterium P01_H01_bin.74]
MEIKNSTDETTLKKPLGKLLWFVLFILGTYLMSLCFQAFRVFTLTPNIQNAAFLLLALLFTSQVLFVMIYDSYIHEKQKGNVYKPIALFEWLITKNFMNASKADKPLCQKE